VPAKAPLDVDLEDKLIYGLTPTRLAYLVVALLGAYSTWSSPWAAAPIRGALASLIIAAGVLAAWGRWRGRAADQWIRDLALFAVRNYRIEWTHQRRLPVNYLPEESVKSDLDSNPLPVAA